MKNNKKFLRIIASLLCCFLFVFSFSAVSFAEENFINTSVKDLENTTYSSYIIADFSGVYNEYLDIPFTITDSTRTVKVMYSVRALDNSNMVTYSAIKKKNANLWFWIKNNLSGNSQILTVGKLDEGDYLLRIKTNQTGSGYSISGQVYYF